MEYRLSLNYMTDKDFHEGEITLMIQIGWKIKLNGLQFIALLGVGAALLTRNKKPVWNPSRIEDVSEQRVLSLFRPLPNNDDLSM